MNKLPSFPLEAKEGEFIAADETPQPEDLARLELPHAPEGPANRLIGRLPDVADLNPEWIIKRLMVEATDRGTRTRQSSRVKALETLAKITRLIDDGVPKEPDAEERAKALDPETRRKVIAAKIKQLVEAGVIQREDLDGPAR